MSFPPTRPSRWEPTGEGGGALLAAWGRRAILHLAESPWMNRTVRRHGPAFGARRFVAGETIVDALKAVQALNRQGLLATLDHLGESVSERGAALASTEACLETLHQIRLSGVRANLSVKLTQLGLDLDAGLCRANLERIVDAARDYGNFVRIDMESSAYTQATLDLYRSLRTAGRDNAGIVVQSYLYRSLADLEALDDLAPNIRLVKGAYNEPETVAFPAKADVDANLRRLIERQLTCGFYTCIASHDERIIAFARELIRHLGTAQDRYEFQMLFGIRPALQRELAAAGHRVRVYVPFGADWYPYLMRRLAERPANLLLVAQNLFNT